MWFHFCMVWQTNFDRRFATFNDCGSCDYGRGGRVAVCFFLVAVCVCVWIVVSNYLNPFFFLILVWFVWFWSVCVPLNNGESFPFNQPRFRRALHFPLRLLPPPRLHPDWGVVVVRRVCVLEMCPHDDFPPDPLLRFFLVDRDRDFIDDDSIFYETCLFFGFGFWLKCTLGHTCNECLPRPIRKGKEVARNETKNGWLVAAALTLIVKTLRF